MKRALLTRESDNAVHCKSSDVFESNVAGDDSDRVDDSVAVFSVVGGVRCEISEADTSRKEYLTARSLPDLTIGKFGASPGCPEILDAFTSVVEGE
jgi:hypothetical protein